MTRTEAKHALQNGQDVYWNDDANRCFYDKKDGIVITMYNGKVCFADIAGSGFDSGYFCIADK